MQRKITFAEGEFYHIYNRGVEKRKIFSDTNDRNRFLRLLFLSNSTKAFKFDDFRDKKFSNIDRGDQRNIAIGAYCLMSNHFHLLVREITEGGISSFMEKLSTGYSMYFNKKHSRVGPLFQGRFKAQHADKDEYLKYLFAYIHLNPVKLIEANWKETGIKNKKRAEQYLHKYRYSSFLDYSGAEREEKNILTVSEFPEYFLGKSDFDNHIVDWLTYKEVTSNFQPPPGPPWTGYGVNRSVGKQKYG